MWATQARTSVLSFVSGSSSERLDLRRLLEQRVHQLPEDLEQQPLLGADVVVQPAALQAGRVAELVHRRGLEAAAREQRGGDLDDLLLTTLVFFSAGGHFVTSVRYKYGMDFDLSDDHELIRRTVRDFAEQEVAPVAEELDRTKAFPYAIVKQLGDLGLMGIPFPEEYGGGGGDSLAYAIAVEELTRVDSSRGDHAVRAHVVGHAADLPVRHRGAEAGVAAEADVRGDPRRVRADRAGGGLGRRQRPHARRAGRRRAGRSTAPSSSSPTPGRTSPASSASRRARATTRSPT